MPVWLRDYSWRQTDAAVYVSLSLRGVRVAPANIFCTDQYLKVGRPERALPSRPLGGLSEVSRPNAAGRSPSGPRAGGGWTLPELPRAVPRGARRPRGDRELQARPARPPCKGEQ